MILIAFISLLLLLLIYIYIFLPPFYEWGSTLFNFFFFRFLTVYHFIFKAIFYTSEWPPAEKKRNNNSNNKRTILYPDGKITIKDGSCRWRKSTQNREDLVCFLAWPRVPFSCFCSRSTTKRPALDLEQEECGASFIPVLYFAAWGRKRSVDVCVKKCTKWGRKPAPYGYRWVCLLFSFFLTSSHGGRNTTEREHKRVVVGAKIPFLQKATTTTITTITATTKKKKWWAERKTNGKSGKSFFFFFSLFFPYPFFQKAALKHTQRVLECIYMYLFEKLNCIV